MKKGLSILGVIVGVVTLAVWLATGAHTGWTQTRVTTMKVDPVTELEYPDTQEKFVAGVEVLAGGVLLSLALLGSSLMFKSQPIKTRKDKNP